MTEREYHERIIGQMRMEEYMQYFQLKNYHRQCACERKAYAEEAQYYKEKEHRELIARNKKICFEEKEMEGFTFQNVERDSGVIRIAEEYVTNW